MNIFVYSDESGVFDKKHNDIFIFAGLIFLSKDEKENFNRKYKNAEDRIRNNNKYANNEELKGNKLKNKEKYSLYRAMNNCYKFVCVIEQQKVLDRIFNSKKDKQRYLDYAYKIAVKNAFNEMIYNRIINQEDIKRIYFFCDEHTTATNGRYELQESLEAEFKKGTYNRDYSIFHPPLFSNLQTVEVKFCNSMKQRLIRAADIIANKMYSQATKNRKNLIKKDKLYIKHLP